MIKKGLLKFSNREFDIEFHLDKNVASEFVKHLPISSICHNIGGEIYFRVPGVNIKYDGTQTNDFKAGDITYWRSPIGEEILSIAIFYGNTQFSNWKSPRSASPCIKIGEILDFFDNMKTIPTGDRVEIILKSK